MEHNRNSFLIAGGGVIRPNDSDCKVIPFPRKCQRRQTVDFIPNKWIREAVIKQYNLRRPERTIAANLKITWDVVRTVVIEAIKTGAVAA